MRYSELFEQMPIGSVPATPIGITPPVPALSGNTGALQDPKMQAANLAKQQQEKIKQKKVIQDQITALQKQLADLNKTA